jgi:hypothetical protein
MMTNKLNTIEITRHIRNALYEQIKDMSLAERLAFYQNQALTFHRQQGIKVATILLYTPDTVSASTENDTESRKA